MLVIDLYPYYVYTVYIREKNQSAFPPEKNQCVQRKPVMDEKEKKCCCIAKTKSRSPEEIRKLKNRLSRLEGQINGIKKMIDDNAYCTDILIQISAGQAAFNSFAKEMLATHIKSCVADGIRSGNEEVIDELVQTLQKLMK